MAVHLLTEKTTKHMLIILFMGAGIMLIGLRWLYFGSNRVLPEDTAWKISLAGRFESIKGNTTIESRRPKPSKYTRLIGQRLYHPGLKLTSKSSAGYFRLKAERSGVNELLLEYDIQLSKTPRPLIGSKPKLDIDERQKYLQPDKHLDLSLASLVNLNKYIQRNVNNKSQLLHNISLHSQKLLEATGKQYNDLKNIIHSNKATTLGRARLMTALCRMNDIPARVVTGLVIRETTLKSPYYWVEIYDEDKSWIPYDPEKGYEASVPVNYIAFDYDSPGIFSVENGQLISANYKLSEDIDTLSIARLEQERNFLDVFNLNRLDFDTRQTMIKLLVLPFCVLLAAFFRHVFGFFPYGTFTPALLALAMVYAEPVITAVVAAIVILLALIGRSLLPKTLPRPPRLSMIFTFVAMSMVLSVSILSYFSIDPGGNIILLPIIILASTVDRFYAYMDAAGTHAALLRLGVTLLIAVFCVPILQYDDLGTLVLTYPEMHFITAGLVLMFSGYKGRKLTDHRYLKLLGENKQKKASKKKASEETADID
jgi:hypothetical protein